MNISQFNQTPYSFEFPVPSTSPHLPRPVNGVKMYSVGYATIEECIAECKDACMEWGVDYNDRDVKLFMTDTDGRWEVTEDGELAG